LDTEFPSPRQPWRVLIDADHQDWIDIRAALKLHQEVGADVAGPNDRSTDPFAHPAAHPSSNRTEMSPTALIDARTSTPASTGSAAAIAPGITISPAASPVPPCSASALASQVTALAGWPRTAEPRPSTVSALPPG